MVEEDLGEATIAYEAPDGETVEETVQNEHVAYFQDHWILRTDEDEQGRDRVRRIPAERVYYVERTVEEFEQEVRTLRDQVQSVADDLRSKLLGGSGDTSGGLGGGTGGGRGGRGDAGESEPEVHRIDVESGESVTDTGSESDASAESESNAGSGSGSNTDAGSGSNGESGSDSESHTESGSDTESDES